MVQLVEERLVSIRFDHPNSPNAIEIAKGTDYQVQVLGTDTLGDVTDRTQAAITTRDPLIEFDPDVPSRFTAVEGLYPVRSDA